MNENSARMQLAHFRRVLSISLFLWRLSMNHHWVHLRMEFFFMEGEKVEGRCIRLRCSRSFILLFNQIVCQPLSSGFRRDDKTMSDKENNGVAVDLMCKSHRSSSFLGVSYQVRVILFESLISEIIRSIVLSGCVCICSAT